MLFNSFDFIFFFIIVTAIFYSLPHRFRWVHLLAASCVFYMAFIPVYILILLFTIFIDYTAGIVIEQAEGKKRKAFLDLSIVANVAVLAVFKYFDFFAININHLLHIAGSASQVSLMNIILPVGLSFHTFQAMSYTIEVYRGNQKAERHMGIYALYVMFYPQLMAGPIERPQNMLPQFYEPKKFDYARVTDGMKLMLWGLFKKVVIADRLALLADPIFNDTHHYTGLAFVMATVMFAFQIFADFSGYSDIAVGAGRVMGFNLMINFNRPYSAKSLSEFWRRWHISLSSWFNDYLFNPLMASLRDYGKLGFAAVIMFTFIGIGFWHGAGWNYIVMGAIYGIAIVYEMLTRKWRKKVLKNLPDPVAGFLCMGLTFSYACFAYIFFRARSLHDAWYIVRHLHTVGSDIAYTVTHHKFPFKSIGVKTLLTSASLIIFMQWAQRKNDVVALINSKPRVIRWAVYYTCILIIVFFGVYQKKQFIYFQF